MKRKSKHTLLFLLLLVILPCKSQTIDKNSQNLPFYNTSLSLDARIQDLISRLTIEEKADQMMHSTSAIERLGILPYSY
jgi:beta-glucosidase